MPVQRPGARSNPGPRQTLVSSLSGPALAALLAVLAIGCTVGATDSGGTGQGGQPAGETCATAGGFGLECNAEIAIKDTGTGQAAKTANVILTGDLDDTGTKVFKFSISNIGNADLKISKIELTYDAMSADEQGKPAFTCAAADGTPCSGASWAVVKPVDGGGTPVAFQVSYRHIDDALKRKAYVRVYSNSKTKSNFVMSFTTAAGAAKLKVSPETMDFEFVQIGDKRIRSVKLTNIGNADLVISGLDLLGLEKDLFVVVVKGAEYPSGQAVKLDPPLLIPVNNTLDLEAVYEGKDDLPHNGTIVLQTNDPSLTGTGGIGAQAIDVKVNSTGPCLIAVPKVVSFGAVKVGGKGIRPLSLQSCGDLPVKITSAVMLEGSSDEFAIDWASVAELGGQPPSVAKPLEIPVNGKVKIDLTFQPESANPVVGGQPVPDKGTIQFESNIVAKTTKVRLEGIASSDTCPTALFTIQEGETVVPQTLLHLDGTPSMDPSGGQVGKYQWEVDQPKGSVELFKPTPGAPSVTFQPNVAGNYVFRLRVWNTAGKESCFAAEKTVVVLPDEAIHVELLWNTPGDKNQSDEGPEAGADMDLHFAHAYASGLDFDGDGQPDPWFDPQYDCFWFNKAPEWGSWDPNVDDNPSLDRDDTDGAGPENLNLTLPEDGLTYAVGVHYFDHHGKGPSQADVRIYVYGQLKFQQKSQDLAHKDMWYVADIAWPSGAITAKGNKTKPYFVTAKYPHPEL